MLLPLVNGWVYLMHIVEHAKEFIGKDHAEFETCTQCV